MILVDSSVWIDHLRKGDATLARMLDSDRVLAHPFGVRERALGSLRQRKLILAALENLPQATVASDSEILRLIDQEARCTGKESAMSMRTCSHPHDSQRTARCGHATGVCELSRTGSVWRPRFKV